MNDMGKNLLVWLVIAAVLLTVFNNFNVPPEPESVTYSQFHSTRCATIGSMR